MQDELGDRIKGQYEDRTRVMLPRRTYTIIRLDGKAFHTLTRGFDRPFDSLLSSVMDAVTVKLCEQIQGVKLGYTQSDEISLLLTDFDSEQTCAWFDGNLQKMASVSASIATAEFNRLVHSLHGRGETKFMNKDGSIKIGLFDSRVFTIADVIEVENYFIWRQNDASRNSVQMAARAVYSHKDLEGKGIPQLHELLHAKGINWNNYTSGEKRGRCVVKESYSTKIANSEHSVARTRWITLDGKERGEIPIFSQDRMFLRKLIPEMGRFDPTTNSKGASIYDCG
jgi:tRNA(His) guanylyltransferase